MKKKSLVCKVGFYEINKLTNGLSDFLKLYLSKDSLTNFTLIN